MSKKVVVIGSGFAGLSGACCLAKQGYKVTILEKNESAGGRASQFSENGFVFDMGPSWYWMPDVIEKFYNIFGKTTSDFYDLKLLDPGYRIFWKEKDITDIPADYNKLCELFESFEKGSAENLDKFLDDAEYKYRVGINELVYKPGRSVFEFADLRLLSGLIKMNLFSSLRRQVYKLFNHDKIRKILEFPVYFLGALPENTPALYSLMNYADLKLKTWYPIGGMYEIVKAMVSIANSLGVEILYNQNVVSVETSDKKCKKVITESGSFDADVIVAAADYHHFEQNILEEKYRQYNKGYWDKRVLAPSALIYFLGVNKKLKNLQHHNLFFDESFELFGKEIYTKPQLPSKPLFYVSATSKTDKTVAPEGKENLFVLIPIAPGLEDSDAIREKYFDIIIDRIEKITGEKFREDIIYKKSFAKKDFQNRYNAFKGNAYGLANTLFQTSIFKPTIKNPKLENLYYA
jgi:phytoene desaturase